MEGANSRPGGILIEPELRSFEDHGQVTSERREMAMRYTGKVSNGTVVLPPEANLPEGTKVRAEPVAPRTLAECLKDSHRNRVRRAS